ncbi:MAG: hypothetical protein AAFP77_13595, partial [Bacteroidota bacterium]
ATPPVDGVKREPTYWFPLEIIGRATAVARPNIFVTIFSAKFRIFAPPSNHKTELTWLTK